MIGSRRPTGEESARKGGSIEAEDVLRELIDISQSVIDYAHYLS
jgi:hypothetical protein